ncbi:MAG: hypothetical protein L0J45_01250 [Psychroflexus sp.]|nr:hypothetical protein [Psychroflexus sp.]MDN6309065.1 hypothetical protein [Psychroflexus sp.]
MKTTRNFLIFLGLSLATLSCSDDDQDLTEIPTSELELAGEIKSDLTLDPSKAYTLSSILSVDNNAILTIPAGTSITTSTGTDVYLVVQQGAKIQVQGTPAAPVVMSPSGSGSWGGLVIAGKGVTSEGVNAIAEVGGILYGGNDNQDDSGSIQYLVMKQTGAQINADSQFNGLTLYAVGENTQIDNVAIIEGQDDGIEFFGGRAHVSNFYAENLQDDAVDWTEGWNGTLENVYISHTEANFSTALEADGVNGNPSLINFTAVSTVGGTALQFKANSGATIQGLSLSGYETTIDMRDNGPLDNVQIEGETASPDFNYDFSMTVNKSDFDWALN